MTKFKLSGSKWHFTKLIGCSTVYISFFPKPLHSCWAPKIDHCLLFNSQIRRLLMWVSRTTLCDKVYVCITKLSTSIQNFKSCHNDIPNIMCMSKDNYLHHLLITNTSNSNMYYKTLSMSNNLSSSFSIMMYAFHFDIRIHFAY